MAGPQPGALRNRPFNPFATMLRPPDPLMVPRRAQPVAAPSIPAPAGIPRTRDDIPLRNPPLPLRPGTGPIAPGGASIQEPESEFTNLAPPMLINPVPEAMRPAINSLVKTRFKERFGTEMAEAGSVKLLQVIGQVTEDQDYLQRLRRWAIQVDLNDPAIQQTIADVLIGLTFGTSESLPGEL